MFVSESGEQLYNYYIEKEEILKKNFQSLSNSITEQNTHDFRVSIKRIRALFRLLEFINPKFSSSQNLKHYRKVFKPVGKIREAKINIQTLEKYKLPKKERLHFIEYSSANSVASTLKLKSRLEAFDSRVLKKNRKLVKRSCRKLKKKEIKHKSLAFIQSRIKTIKGIISNTEIASIHNDRKNLKEISAIVPLLKRIKLSGFNNALLNTMKSTEDLIGDWHDKEVLLESIEGFINYANPGKESISYYREIQKQISAENKEFLLGFEKIVLKTLHEIEKPLKAI